MFDTANPILNHCGRAFYSWGDHKVVPYGGRYYDPSYRAIYPTLASMATYHAIRELTIGPDDYLVADDRVGSRCYFRLLTVVECGAVVPPVGFGSAMQGPYFGLLPNGTNLMTIKK